MVTVDITRALDICSPFKSKQILHLAFSIPNLHLMAPDLHLPERDSVIRVSTVCLDWTSLNTLEGYRRIPIGQEQS